MPLLISFLASFACLASIPQVLSWGEVMMSEVHINQWLDATGYCTAPSQVDKDLVQE